MEYTIRKPRTALNKAFLKVKLNTDISALETEIDQLVYKLYGLTDAEIRIIEGKD